MLRQGAETAAPAPGRPGEGGGGVVGERDNLLWKHLALTSVTSNLGINVFRHQLASLSTVGADGSSCTFEAPTTRRLPLAAASGLSAVDRKALQR